MANSLTRVFVHLVWATRQRAPWIDRDVEACIRQTTASQAERLACPLHAFGAWDDHVHTLIELDRRVALVTLVRALKGASAHDVTRRWPALMFRWQEGYGAFSVSEREPEQVLAYVRDQREHHARAQLETVWEPTEAEPEPGG